MSAWETYLFLVPKAFRSLDKSSFELVHVDVWGLSRSLSTSGFSYFVTFIDDYSRCTWLFLMKTRAEFFSMFKKFNAEIRTQFNTSIRILRSDNAKEYSLCHYLLLCLPMGFFTNHLVLTLLNRMEWLNVRTVIELRQFTFSSFIISFLNVCWGMLS